MPRRRGRTRQDERTFLPVNSHRRMRSICLTLWKEISAIALEAISRNLDAALPLTQVCVAEFRRHSGAARHCSETPTGMLPSEVVGWRFARAKLFPLTATSLDRVSKLQILGGCISFSVLSCFSLLMSRVVPPCPTVPRTTCV